MNGEKCLQIKLLHGHKIILVVLQSKTCIPRRGDYTVYSTFQSHEPEFDYLKSLEIEEKINKIRWLRRKNQAHFLLSTNGNVVRKILIKHLKHHC